MIGGDGVHHDQEDVGGVRRDRPAPIAPLLDPIGRPGDRREGRHRAGEDRSAEEDDATEGRPRAAPGWGPAGPKAQGHEEPGQAVDLREGREQHGQQGQDAERSRDRPAAARGPERHDQASGQPGEQEDQQVGQRDQPDEMSAHAQQLVRVEEPLAHDERRDLEQAREHPAPRREAQQRDGAEPGRAVIRRPGLARAGTPG